jgi:hypothetical protein
MAPVLLTLHEQTKHVVRITGYCWRMVERLRGASLYRNDHLHQASRLGNRWPALLPACTACAYELYETEGRREGHNVQDWLRAEQELGLSEIRKPRVRSKLPEQLLEFQSV